MFLNSSFRYTYFQTYQLCLLHYTLLIIIKTLSMKKYLSVAFFLAVAFLPYLSAQCLKGDCYNGKGTYLYPSGAKYIGQFRNGKIHGQGILYFSNGNKYVGDWKYNYREGYGRLVFSNGDEYEGQFLRSKFNGEGALSYHSGDEYDGEWVDDKMEGRGIYSFRNGDRYEGSFRDNKFDGNGTMFYGIGGKYVGNWKDNKKNGEGTLYDKNGNATVGFWVDGKIINRDKEEPITHTETGEDEDLRNCNKSFCRDGQGVYTYSDGSKWIGYFKDGMPEGKGTCFYANGNKYTGEWKRHAPHGKGVMRYRSGRVLGAIWKYGKPTGKLDSEPDKPKQEMVEVENSNEVKIWAVVVGVARYTHMPVLKYTDDDAYQIFAFLKSPEGGALPDDQIRVLIDENATKENIVKTMRQLFLKADANDVILFYYSGHGYSGSFLPVDFDGYYNQLKHTSVKSILEESKAKHKLVLADACHSGSLMALKSAPHAALKKYYAAFENTKGGTALLMSSKGEEFSLEDKGLRQGIFSHFLIRGLKGEADADRNQIVTIKELYDFVFDKVRDYTRNIQSPTLTGDFDQNMPVAVKR